MIPAAAGSDPLWSPSPERVEKANITRYVAWLERERGFGPRTTRLFSAGRSRTSKGFWASIWDFFGVDAEQAYEGVLGSREMPGAEWFPGARLSTRRTSSVARTTRRPRSITRPSCASCRR